MICLPAASQPQAHSVAAKTAAIYFSPDRPMPAYVKRKIHRQEEEKEISLDGWSGNVSHFLDL